MNPKVLERERVIALRRKGLTYREILTIVPVSKSSISVWLKHLPLTDLEKNLLKHRKSEDVSRWRLRGAASRKAKWNEQNQRLYEAAKAEFAHHIQEPFFQVGLALYWAEGSKRNSFFAFTNSDSDMLNLMIRWAIKYLKVSKDDIKLRLYTHKPFAHEGFEEYWSKATGIDLRGFGKTINKPTGLMVKKRPNYKGCIRMELGKIVNLRKTIFWQQMLIEYYRNKG